jgi:hypothetical protein
MSGFKFDERALEAAVKKTANEGVRKIAAQHQALLDGLLDTHSGRPLDEVKEALRSGWQKLGGSLGDAELTQYAEYIRDGRRIVFQPQELK